MQVDDEIEVYIPSKTWLKKFNHLFGYVNRQIAKEVDEKREAKLRQRFGL